MIFCPFCKEMPDAHVQASEGRDTIVCPCARLGWSQDARIRTGFHFVIVDLVTEGAVMIVIGDRLFLSPGFRSKEVTYFPYDEGREEFVREVMCAVAARQVMDS